MSCTNSSGFGISNVEASLLPRGIDVANVMEALRQMVLRKKHDEVSLDDLSAEELRELPQIAIVSNQRKLTS